MICNLQMSDFTDLSKSALFYDGVEAYNKIIAHTYNADRVHVRVRYPLKSAE